LNHDPTTNRKKEMRMYQRSIQKKVTGMLLLCMIFGMFVFFNAENHVYASSERNIINTIVVTASDRQYSAYPNRVAVDDANNVYFSDYGTIRRLDPSGNVTRIAGTGTMGYSGDGSNATAAQLNLPKGIAVDSAGNVFIADSKNNRVRKIDTTGGVIRTIAGTGVAGYSGDKGYATSAQLNMPSDVAVDNDGNVYIADSVNHVIRKIDTSGIITTIIGYHEFSPGYAGDGNRADYARMDKPLGVAVDDAGNIYISDWNNNVIRKVDTTGIINTIVSDVRYPLGLDVDSSGNLYIADRGYERILKLQANGQLSTITGDYANYGFSGDGSDARDAKLHSPNGVAVGNNGHLYIADYFNYRIRKVEPAYTVTYNGNGNDGGSRPSNHLHAIAGDTTATLSDRGSLSKIGHTFAGWNTQADGSGTAYAAGGSVVLVSDVLLYAQWKVNSYTVTYEGNGKDEGSPPLAANHDYNSSVTVLDNTGNLGKTGYTFDGWNTRSDGSGTDYAADENWNGMTSFTWKGHDGKYLFLGHCCHHLEHRSGE
jgi:sugar lactone lactonase YvrE